MPLYSTNPHLTVRAFNRLRIGESLSTGMIWTSVCTSVILIDTKTSAGKCFLDMLGVFGEFETNLRKERQMEGILKAKEKGVYKGRKPSVDVQKVKELRDSGLGASKIAKELGIGRASVYRALEV